MFLISPRSVISGARGTAIHYSLADSVDLTVVVNPATGETVDRYLIAFDTPFHRLENGNPAAFLLTLA